LSLRWQRYNKEEAKASNRGDKKSSFILLPEKYGFRAKEQKNIKKKSGIKACLNFTHKDNAA